MSEESADEGDTSQVQHEIPFFFFKIKFVWLTN